MGSMEMTTHPVIDIYVGLFGIGFFAFPCMWVIERGEQIRLCACQ
jgi:hypothetical protein